MTTLTWYKGIILGLIQGLTEFFPVSSSAHLVIAQNYLGIRESTKSLATFDVFLHLGTLVAAVYFFRWDLARMFCVWIKPLREKLDAKAPSTSLNTKMAKRVGPLVLVGIIPAGLIGAGFHQFFEDLFSDVMMVSIFLLITGAVINATKKIQGDGIGFAEMNFKHALLIGLAQVFSILPGISRSGSTIACGLFVKLKPEIAFRYSFLMMIFIVGGAFILEVGELRHLELDIVLAALFGAITAGVAGYYCIGIMLKLMVQGKFPLFAYYCWTVGSLVILKEMFF